MFNAYHAIINYPSYWDGVINARRDVLTNSIRECDSVAIKHNSSVIEYAESFRNRLLLGFNGLIKDLPEFREYETLTSIYQLSHPQEF